MQQRRFEQRSPNLYLVVLVLAGAQHVEDEPRKNLAGYRLSPRLTATMSSSANGATPIPGEDDRPMTVEALWEEIKRMKRGTVIEAAAESERNFKSEHQLHELQLASNRLQSEIDAAPSRNDLVLECRKLRTEMMRVVEEQVGKCVRQERDKTICYNIF